VLGAALLLCGTGTALASTVLQLTGAGGQPPQAAPGTGTSVCIQMLNSDGQVAGVQMDFAWDPDCLSANVRSSGGPQCRSNPATGKTVQSAMRGGSSLRAIMLSVADVNPIPDGELFCCEFTVDSFASAAQCPIRLGNVIGANSTGQRVPVSPREGVVYVVGGGQPDAAPPAAGGVVPAAPGGATTGGAAAGALSGGAPAAGLPSDAPAAGAAPAAGLAPRVEAPAPPPAAPVAGDIERAAQLPGEAPAPEEIVEEGRAAVMEEVREAIDTPSDRTKTATTEEPEEAAPAPTSTPQPPPATATVAPTKTPRPATPTTAPTLTPTTASGFLGGCVMVP
jgi:hypothetical protein